MGINIYPTKSGYDPSLYQKTFRATGRQSCAANEVYTTLVNISNEGFLDAVSHIPSSIGSSNYSAIKITIDGNVVLWLYNLQSDNTRLGLTIPNALLTAIVESPSGQATYPSASPQLKYNYLMSNPLYFKTSLKIEIAQTNTSTGDVIYEYKYTTK